MIYAHSRFGVTLLGTGHSNGSRGASYAPYASILCFNYMLPLDASILCLPYVLPLDASILCFHYMLPLDATTTSFH